MVFPDACGFGVGGVSCSVAAFNERGRGLESGGVAMAIPCDSDSQSFLSSSFLGNPLTSLILLLLLVVLLLLAMTTSAVLCVCCRGKWRKKPASQPTSDDSYVSMAPSDTAMKIAWSGTHNPEPSVSLAPIQNPPPSNVNDPAYDEIPADESDNLYDEIHPRNRIVPTITEDTEIPGGGVSQGTMAGSRLTSNHSVAKQQKSKHKVQSLILSNGSPTSKRYHFGSMQSHSGSTQSCPGSTQSRPGSTQFRPGSIQSRPGSVQFRPNSTLSVSPVYVRSEARDSTLTQYIEVQSPLVDDDPLLPSNVRYSTADSGVMSSSDVEQGPILDIEMSSNNYSHSVTYENESMGQEGVQSGGFPYYTTTLPLSNAHPDKHVPDAAGDNSFYTVMMPHSILQQSRDSHSNDDINACDVIGDDVMDNDVINNDVIDVIREDVIEDGVGTEVDFSTVMVEEIFLDSTLGIESGQKTAPIPVYAVVKKRERKRKGTGEGGRQGEKKEGGKKEKEEEEEKDGRGSKLLFGEKEDGKKREMKRFEK